MASSRQKRLARASARSRARHNPAPKKAPTVTAASSWGMTPAVVVGVALLAWLFWPSEEKDDAEDRAEAPTGPAPSSPPASTPPRATSASTELVARLANNTDDARLVFAIQALPYVFSAKVAGATYAHLPTGKKDDEEAKTAISAVMNEPESPGAAVPPPWDGTYTTNLLVALRKRLNKPTSVRRPLPVVPPPAVAGEVYAFIVAADPDAVNPFNPDASVPA